MFKNIWHCFSLYFILDFFVVVVLLSIHYITDNKWMNERRRWRLYLAMKKKKFFSELQINQKKTYLSCFAWMKWISLELCVSPEILVSTCFFFTYVTLLHSSLKHHHWPTIVQPIIYLWWCLMMTNLTYNNSLAVEATITTKKWSTTDTVTHVKTFHN